MVRVIVVEEERAGRHRLEQLLRQEPDLEILACCRDGREAAGMIAARLPDAVFLGIHVRGLNGISIVAGLARDTRPAIVFVSDDERRAFDAFQVGALDFLPPSCSHARLQEAIERVRSHVRCRRQAGLAARLRSLLDEDPGDHAAAAPPQRLIRSGDRTRIMAPGDVLWIRSEGNYARLHRASGETVLLRGTIEDAAGGLNTPFVRIHRSAGVRLAAIREIRRQPGGSCIVVLIEGTALRVGRTYREDLEKRLQGDVALP